MFLNKLKAFAIILLILIAIPCLITFLLYISYTKSNSYISVTETNGKDKIYIDNKYIDNTPKVNINIKADKHDITIEKEKNPDKYYKLTKPINFEENTNNIINVALGPSLEYSFYSIFTFKKMSASPGVLINLENSESINDLKIKISGKDINKDTVNTLKPGTYNLDISASKYDGYTTSVNIIKQYILIITVHLRKKPI